MLAIRLMPESCGHVPADKSVCIAEFIQLFRINFLFRKVALLFVRLRFDTRNQDKYLIGQKNHGNWLMIHREINLAINISFPLFSVFKCVGPGHIKHNESPNRLLVIDSVGMGKKVFFFCFVSNHTWSNYQSVLDLQYPTVVNEQESCHPTCTPSSQNLPQPMQ